MSSRCTVVIGAQALLPALSGRLSAAGSEVVAFSDTDTLRALETLSTRHPDVVAIERSFAATARGAALINRITADPALRGSTVRIVAQDPIEQAPPTPAITGGTHPDADARREPRYELAGAIEASIDNASVVLVNLSTFGAQVVSASVLKPNQRVRLSITDGKTTLKNAGAIVWARFEIPPGSGPRYRAGIEFTNPDRQALGAFCRTHQKA